MANSVRGEMDIVLEGKLYTLRPTFHALCELEQRSGAGLYRLALRFEEGTFTLEDIACIVWSGIRGTLAQDTPTFEEIGEAIIKDGFARLIGPCCHYLATALGVRVSPGQQNA